MLITYFIRFENDGSFQFSNYKILKCTNFSKLITEYSTKATFISPNYCVRVVRVGSLIIDELYCLFKNLKFDKITSPLSYTLLQQITIDKLSMIAIISKWYNVDT